MKMRTAALALVVAGLGTGCATGPDRKPGDPLEPMNRAIFKFNDAIDTHIAVPVAKGYQKVTPQPLRQAISNFFSNLGDLPNAANNLLQLHITDATEDVMRFAINTVFGLGGLIDWATPAGLPKHHEDFGLTLGHWGVPAGPYLVLPLFGPSSFRDGTGLIVDVRSNLLQFFKPAVRNPLYVLQFVSVRSDLLGASSLLQAAALDKYSFVRDAYRQQRESLLRGSGATPAPLPDYGDPGASGDGAAPPSGASGTAPNGLPDYSDPGDSSDGASGPAAASGSAAPAAGGTPQVPAAAPAGNSKVGAPSSASPAPGSAPAPAPASAPQ